MPSVVAPPGDSGGDIVFGNGRGGDSIYGPRFRDERFLHKHDRAGLLAMANTGPDTNSSQFYLTLCAAPHLDGSSVVFGEVVEGLDVLESISRDVAVDKNDVPKVAVTIQDCGEVDVSDGDVAVDKNDVPKVAVTVQDCGEVDVSDGATGGA